MLADLRLEELPYEALIALKKAVDAEVHGREEAAKGHAHKLAQCIEAAARAPHPKGGPGPLRLPEDAQALPPFPLLNTIRQLRLPKRLGYLAHVLAQDWTACFPTAGQDQRQFYVYAHLDPRQDPLDLRYLDVRLQGQPFYIGKGSGARAWNLKRNEGHGKRLRALQALGYPPTAIVHLIAEQLTEQEALCLEAKLIYFFGSMYDPTVKGCLVNLADHMRPAFVREEIPPEPRPPRRGKGNTPPADHAVRHAWKQFQGANGKAKYLPATLLEEGYAVVQVQPHVREGFLLCAKLCKYRSRYGPTQDLPPNLQNKWHLWLSRTERLIAHFEQQWSGRVDMLPV